MLNKPLVVFDFDGVIVDSFDAALEVVREHQPDIEVEEESYRDCFNGNVFEVKDTKNFCFVFPEFSDQYLPKLTASPAYNGIVEVIQALAERKTLALVSSTRSDVIRAWLERHHILDCFSDILGADVATSKVEKFKMLLEKYHLEATNTCFITDTLGDLGEAQKLDVPAIAVSYGYHNRSRLEHGVSRAIIDRPEELILAIEKVDFSVDLKETYNRIAQDWNDQHRGDDWWFEGTNAFISLLPQHASVLDVGCANGIKTKYLVDHGLNVTGIDFSENMIQLAKKRVPEAALSVFDMYEMDAFDGIFDGIYLSAVILHVPKNQIVALLRKIVKHLKDGGYLYIAVKEKRENEQEEEVKVEHNLGYSYERFFSFFSADEVVRYLNLAGLHMTSARLTTSGRRNWIQVIGKKGNE